MSTTRLIARTGAIVSSDEGWQTVAPPRPAQTDGTIPKSGVGSAGIIAAIAELRADYSSAPSVDFDSFVETEFDQDARDVETDIAFRWDD